MIKTTDVVRKLFLHSDTAQLAAHEGVLNVSAFARQIKQPASDSAKKDIEVGTITTALYRLLDEYSFKSFKPSVKLHQLTIHPNVVDLTFERNTTILTNLPQALQQLSDDQRAFYTVTQGPEEITVIVDEKLEKNVITALGQPQKKYPNLVALSVRFDEKYLEIPNMIYTLLASFAVKRINILEIVSTYTSLSFVVKESEMNRALAALKRHL